MCVCTCALIAKYLVNKHSLLSVVSISVDKLHSIYPDLVKRLDDSSDEIRIATTKTLTAFVR